MQDGSGVGERHFMLFGKIVQSFAAHELLMSRIMAHLLGTQTASAMLVTHHLTFEEKHRTLLDLLRHRNVPLDQYDRVRTYLNVLLTLAPLRNDIVHSVWVPAQSPGLIQPDWILNPPPRLKALHAGADSPPGDFVEDDTEKSAYSLDDFTEIAANLENNLALFSDYAAEAGLVGKF